MRETSHLAAVYIPLRANKDAALKELHGLISRQEIAQCPDTVLVIDWDFNHADYTKFMPKLLKHIPFKTQGENTLDLSNTLFRDGYRALPCPAFGESDHCLVLLIPDERASGLQNCSTLVSPIRGDLSMLLATRTGRHLSQLGIWMNLDTINLTT